MTFAEIAAAIVLAVSGHPGVMIGCDADTNNPYFNFPVAGWAIFGGNEVHLHPQYCADMDPRVWRDSVTRGVALGVLIHEAAHARGVRSEQCAEMYAGVLMYEYLERFYGISMFSAESWEASRWWVVRNRSLPQNYWWTDVRACDNEP